VSYIIFKVRLDALEPSSFGAFVFMLWSLRLLACAAGFHSSDGFLGLWSLGYVFLLLTPVLFLPVVSLLHLFL
jgi:hypothetical protein